MSSSKEILAYVRGGPAGLKKIQMTVAVAAASATNDSVASVPANFYPLFMHVDFSAGITNAVTLDDIGTNSTDENGFVRGGALAFTAAKMQAGTSVECTCNGAKGMGTAELGGEAVPAVANEPLRLTYSGVTGTAITATVTMWGCGG